MSGNGIESRTAFSPPWEPPMPDGRVLDIPETALRYGEDRPSILSGTVVVPEITDDVRASIADAIDDTEPRTRDQL